MKIYFDYNSTSILDDSVAELMCNLLKSGEPYNPSSIHSHGRKARSLMENARNQIADALHFDAYKGDLQIIFTSSGTEANNLVLNSFSNNQVFVGSTEHVSILEISNENKIIIPVNSTGIIDPVVLQKLLKQNPGKKFVSIMLANNETGVIQDIKALSLIAHQEGAIFHCDASQAFCKIDIDFKSLGCDLMTISSHKSGGPLGAAALIGKKNFQIKPQIKGGKQEQGLRSGTENIIAIVGFGLAAAGWKDKIEKFKQIEFLRNKMEEQLEGEIIAKSVNRLPNTSCIRMQGVKNEEQLIKFDLAGISVSAGSACSSGRIAGSHVLKAMEMSDSDASEVIRVSLGLKTTEKEVNKFIELWKEISNERR